MKKRILSLFLVIALLINALTIVSFAADKGNAITIEPGADLQQSLDVGGSRLYRITADETQYYEFKIRNQSIEVNTGIGFADGFLNLFLGKMHIKIFDAYDDDVGALDVKCGYTGTLSVRFQKDKVYYIEVSSTVAGNYHMTVSKLADLGANSWTESTPTESTGQIVSEIEAAGDRDWFTFKTDEIRSYYYFSLENIQADTMYYYLYEHVEGASQPRTVRINGSDCISSSKNSTSSFNLQLKQNTVYYFCICSTSSGTGNYIVNATRSADAAGNTRSDEDAYKIDFDVKYTTSFDGKEDSDYYVFTTPEYDAYYHVSYTYLSFNGTAYSEIYDEGGNKIASWDKYKDSFSYNAKLKPSTKYFVCFYGNGTGNYEFKVSPKADEYKNERKNATAVSLDTEYSTSFDGKQDSDYVKFTTPDFDAYYHVSYTYLSFNGTAYSEIYDADGNEIASWDKYKDSFTYNARLDKNTTYYVCFYGDGTGNYKFKINTYADEYANSREKANEVSLDTEYSTSFDGKQDSDWVKFTTPDFDAYYHVRYTYLSFNGTAYSEIYDADGNEIASWDKYKDSFTYNKRLDKNTTYYVCFYGDGTGNYKFAINTKADIYPQTRAEATEVELNKEYSTSFNGVKDHDYVKFTTLDTNAYYTVEYIKVNFTGTAYSDIYDQEGNSIANNNKYSDSFSYSANLEPNTTYYVCFYGDGVGNYKFKINAIADADGDNKENATELSSNQKYPSSLEAKNDVDWFEVTLSESANLLIKLENESVPYGMYFDVYSSRDAKVMSSSYTGSGSTSSQHKQLDAGTYYIEVYGGGKGYYTLTVSPCGNGHTEVIDYAVEASCTGTGLTEGKHCSVCNTVIKKQETTKAKGHSYSYGVCKVCGDKDPNYIPTFTDVKAKAWYKQYVDYSVKNGIFSGTSKTTFSPNDNITRAQFVQVLANLEGVDTSNRNVKTQFSDVPAKKWFTAAVKWASENKIVNGVGGGKFDPNANVTREQMCLMLTNYAKFKGITLKAVEAKESFADDKKISKWAKTAVYTCQMADIVNGKGAGKFDPQGTGTRAEASVIFTKFHKDYLVK